MYIELPVNPMIDLAKEICKVLACVIVVRTSTKIREGALDRDDRDKVNEYIDFIQQEEYWNIC